jgi:hypothetical protein
MVFRAYFWGNKMQSVKLSVIGLVLFFSSNANAVKLKDCDAYKSKIVKEAYELSMKRGLEMLKEARAIIDGKRYDISGFDPETVTKFKKAHNKVVCTLKKLKKSKFTCANKNSKGNAIARTMPVLGKGATLYDGYFTQSFKYQASTLFHEMTHKCGASDSEYFYQQRINPSRKAHKNWHNIASFYDWWFMNGVCFPGENC